MIPKKSLGQNFLNSSYIAEELARAANIKRSDAVVEVGPGTGMVTEFLLAQAKKIIAVEKDARMILYLKEKFSKEISSGKLVLVHNDILNFNPQSCTLVASGYKLVGAIPYYITGVFLRTFLSHHNQPKTIALIIQKEVALRLRSGQAGQKKTKESILSISVKAFGEPTYVKTVSRKLFSPEPKVDSAIITIENISRKFFKDIEEDLFFKLVKAGFASKRKKVLSNIKKQFPNTNWEKVFIDLDISHNARAENLTPEQWRTLTEKASAQH